MRDLIASIFLSYLVTGPIYLLTSIGNFVHLLYSLILLSLDYEYETSK